MSEIKCNIYIKTSIKLHIYKLKCQSRYKSSIIFNTRFTVRFTYEYRNNLGEVQDCALLYASHTNTEIILAKSKIAHYCTLHVRFTYEYRNNLGEVQDCALLYALCQFRYNYLL